MVDEPEKQDAAFAYYRRLGRVRDYVEGHYASGISLGKAAQIAHLEANYFSAYFRQKIGVCFKDWLAQLRIKHAKAMLTSENHCISEIAFATGFHDVRTFQRTFKRCTGMTPRAFKKSVRPA